MRKPREQGIALITTLLILILLSAMTVGIAWLVVGDRKLGGNNSDRQLAFYGAEAGIESLTASLEDLFDQNYAPNATAINNLMVSPGPPANIPGIQYIAPGQMAPGTGYQITFTPTPGAPTIPETSWGTIPTGTYAGLVGLMTPYTITVTARTPYGSEARLQREVQTVAIPIFQFGFFSQMDLSFFAGPNFNFGGRVHTNGNLWLAEGNGDTLTMTQKVTAAGEIISENLENGWQTTTNYTGAVNITNGSGVTNLIAQTPPQSVVGAANYYQNIGAYNAAFAGMANSVYNNDIAVAQTGVKPLNLSIATPAIGGQPIDLIRWPQPNENTTNLGKLQERYYTQVSLRILLADYGPSGTCVDSPISSSNAIGTMLPYLANNGAGTTPTPVDLAWLAWDTSAPVGSANNQIPGADYPPYHTAPLGFTSNATWNAQLGITIFPLPVSNAQVANSYSPTDGYWVQKWFPTTTGCLKIDYQNNTSTAATPVWTDVTWEILGLGYTGRNINPQVNKNGVPAYIAPPARSGWSGTTQTAASGPNASTITVTTVGCQDPSPNAVIRFARLRDNPTSAVAGNDYCGNNEGNTVGTWSGLATQAGNCVTTQSAVNCPGFPVATVQHGTDYWPNVLFDTREALLRDAAPTGAVLPVAGGMTYVELDMKNLAKWFTGVTGVSGGNVLATNGYAVYFSDRRGEQKDPNPPPSVATTPALTGGYGYDDIINPSSANGCPDGVEQLAEDFEDDTAVAGGTVRTYGNILNPPSGTGLPTALWTMDVSGVPGYGTQVESVASMVGGATAILTNNPSCTGPGTKWPYAAALNGSDMRQNPPIFFRRALKIVDADTISFSPKTCNSVACGLTTVSENPVYLQGCYNNPTECNMTSVSWSASSVGSAVIADAITLLSNSWNDVNSFAWPYGMNSGGYNITNGGRNATTTTYRLAAAGGKNIPFQQPTVGTPPQDFGTDGGAHNFLRYLENWGGQTLYYEGSIVSMYYNHQAAGIYKCCNTVYSPPSRGYQFDTNFLTPSLLPPLTPMLRTVNTIGFTQILTPTE
ncbi:MAG TPA: PilX N-terminal domain-containing pilus assembly protein [Candidatus Acidoferrales bacterium]|nr:PilX N-terminal domain-containing pilus assembly protein [Candidatus Acidoferrales bacterium]